MSELHEIYATLLKRGMPEHPNLRCCGRLLAHRAFEEDDDIAALCDDDTRDLLTMHALRWCLKTVAVKDATFTWLEWPNYMKPKVWFNIVSGDFVSTNDGVDAESYNSIFDCILSATAHLEPK